ncbi:hypothetical protein VTP01DRAFT_8697 [Rhizomucor pusillus]|uniref:uncharacterized protein n=1 Tax=Rhizomucor pusillus TaxID=4840 RepID=UPI003743C5E2
MTNDRSPSEAQNFSIRKLAGHYLTVFDLNHRPYHDFRHYCIRLLNKGSGRREGYLINARRRIYHLESLIPVTEPRNHLYHKKHNHR